MPHATADLCDQHGEAVRVVAPLFRDFGGTDAFSGKIATVFAPEDNVLVRAALEERGEGRVLVVDGEGSTRCALLGDNLAAIARDNGWAGIVVHGCIRDAEEIGRIAIGVKALATCPRKSNKGGKGSRDQAVTFGGVTFNAGEWLYADADGIVVSPGKLAG
jgi:regulator of ribonuclease activity A